MATERGAWILLVLAGLFEIGWPLGFKLSQIRRPRLPFLLGAAASMGLSSLLLWLAQRTIPIGTAYAVWTGIGAAGTFIAGILLFHDAAGLMRILSFFLIIAGVIGLKLAE
jgi:quaternary ammonium compound-resistance protein SugE